MSLCQCSAEGSYYGRHASWCPLHGAKPAGVMGPVVTPEDYEARLFDDTFLEWLAESDHAARNPHQLQHTLQAAARTIRWYRAALTAQIEAARRAGYEEGYRNATPDAPAVPTGVATTPQGETSTLAERVNEARREMAGWSEERRANVQLEGSGRSTTRDRE